MNTKAWCATSSTHVAHLIGAALFQGLRGCRNESIKIWRGMNIVANRSRIERLPTSKGTPSNLDDLDSATEHEHKNKLGFTPRWPVFSDQT